MFNSSLNKLLRQYLKKYELIEKIDINNIENQDIYNFISNNIHKENYLQAIDLPSELNSNSFWRTNLITLINNFQIYFGNQNQINNNEEQNSFLKYSTDMELINYNSKININIINQNFNLISEGFKDIILELFPDKSSFDSKYGKFSIIFNNIINELFPIWENLLYLWLVFILSKVQNLEPTVIKYIYLNESNLINFKKFNIKKNLFTIDDVIKNISIYIDEYPNSHLCIIPIIRRNNYYLNYYSEEIYPGIFYHAPNFDNKIFKCSKKFIYYPFKIKNSLNSLNSFNPFENEDFVRAGCIKDNSPNNFYLGSSAYGFRIYNDSIYYAAPFDEINQIREIVPKAYYTAIRSIPSGNIYVSNGMLLLENFRIDYYDAIKSNLDENALIGSYQTTDNVTTYLQLFPEITKTEQPYYLENIIELHHTTVQKTKKELTKIRNYKNKDNFSFNYYLGECISACNQSIEEDYSYLIEYIPFEYSWDNEHLINDEQFIDLIEYAGDASDFSTLAYKDNDLLTKHYVWDDERNNILDEKFILRIGQHLKMERFNDETKDLIPSEYKVNNKITYFDYINNTNDIEEKTTSENIERYNTGTIEIGAYLNIPFIKNRKKRVQYYPDFLSHKYSSDNLIPLTLIEQFNIEQGKPEYFSYNKLFKNYSANKNTYFQVYTENGMNEFDNHNWGIKMIEVINQDTPSENTFIANNSFFPSTIQTMEELYNYYNENKNKIYSLNILPFFSQLNPSSTIESTKTVINTSILKESIKSTLQLKNKGYLPQWSNNTNTLNEIENCFIENICQYLTMDQIPTNEIIQIFLRGSSQQIWWYEGYNIYETNPGSRPEGDSGYKQPYTGFEHPLLTWYSTQENFDILIDNLKNILGVQELSNVYHHENNTPISENEIITYTQYKMYYSKINLKLFLYGVTDRTAHKNYKNDSITRNLPIYEYWTPKINTSLETDNNIDEIYAATEDIKNLKNYLLFPIFEITGRDRSFRTRKYTGQYEVSGHPHPSFTSQTDHIAYHLICGTNIPSNVYHSQYAIWYTIVDYDHLVDGNYLYDGLGDINGASRTAVFKGKWPSQTPIATYPTDATNGSLFYSIPKFSTTSVHYEQHTSFKGYNSHRQIPHLFLSSNKTYFPNNQYYSNKKYSKISYKIYNSNKNENVKLSDFYIKISNLNINNQKKLPYPFPTKKVSYSESQNELKEQIIDNFAELINPSPTSIALTSYMNEVIKNTYDIYMDIGDKTANTCNTIKIRPDEENIQIKNLNQQTSTKNQFLNDTDFNVTSTIGYEDLNAPNIGTMNIQIIIHWFGPDGKYARKVLTRELNGTPSQDNYFVVDGQHELTYQNWTNNWSTEYFNQAIFTEFETNKNNNTLKLFKESASLTTPAGHLDFETYKNNGINF